MSATVHSFEPQLDTCPVELPESKPRRRHQTSLRISVLKKKLKISFKNEGHSHSRQG